MYLQHIILSRWNSILIHLRRFNLATSRLIGMVDSCVSLRPTTQRAIWYCCNASLKVFYMTDRIDRCLRIPAFNVYWSGIDPVSFYVPFERHLDLLPMWINGDSHRQ